MSSPKTAPQTKVIYSPLKRFQKQHCGPCGGCCHPTDREFLLCVLCDLADTIRRNNELNKLRYAHL